MNINVVITIYCQHNWIFLRQKKIISIHYLTGQNRGLSGLKNIWPVIMTGNLLSVICSPENYLAFELKELHNMTIEPPIGTCSHKQNFPCDDQVRIDDIVIESKTSGLNLKKKMHKRSWGTILCVITNPQGTCSKITFTGAESKFLSLFSNVFFHNAIDIITLSVWVTST